MNLSCIVAVAACLTPVFAVAGELESLVAKEGMKFDFTLEKDSAASAVQGREGGPKPTAFAQLTGAKSPEAHPPSPSIHLADEDKAPRGFWGAIGNAAREASAAGVGVVVGAVSGVAYLPYAASIIGPVLLATNIYDNYSYGEALLIHMMSPVASAIDGFKRARNATLDALS